MSSNPLWDRAVEAVRSTPEWGSYRKILDRSVGHGQTHPQGTQAPAAESTEDQPQAVLNIINDALRAIQDKAKTDKSEPLRRIFSQTVKVLVSVKDMGSAIAALNPYASLAWSGIHFLLQLAVNNREANEMAWDNLPRMTYLVSVYQTFEEVFLQPLPSKVITSMLDDALVALYTAVLQYQIAVVVRVGSKMEKFKTAFRGASKSSIQRAVTEVTEKEKDLDRIRVIADRATITNLIENVSLRDQAKVSELFADLEKSQKDFIASQEYVTNSVGEILTSSRDIQNEVVLDWLSTYRYENSHNKPEKTALENTGSWLLQHDDYQKWKNSAQSALWLRGFVGSGKSCLTHIVIDDLRNSSSCSEHNAKALAFFYFEGGDSDCVHEMSDSTRVLRCLAKQLAMARYKACIPDCVTEAWKSYHHKADLPALQCVPLLKTLLSEFKSTIFVFDGFDECPHRVQRDLVRHLKNILVDTNMNLRLFISGRPSIETSIRALDCSVLDIGENNTEDIYKVIDTGIAEALDDPALEELYIDGPEDQSSAVRDMLRSHANGMFRWVVLAFNHLHKSLHYDAMTRRLRSLPNLEDLFDLYDVIWQNMINELDDDDRLAVRTLLCFALYEERYSANTRLVESWSNRYAIEKIAEAAKFKSRNSANQNLTTEKIVLWCNAFVIFNNSGSGSPLRFPHFSAKEYLRWRHAYWFSEKEGHIFLACLCMDVFISPPIDMENLLDYATYYWVDHLRSLCDFKTALDSLQHLLEERLDLQNSVRKFITDSNPTKPFSQWAARVIDNDIGFTIDGEALSLATTPCTATAAMIAFNIGFQTSTFKNFSARPFVPEEEKQVDALAFAARVGNLNAIKFILADEGNFPKSRQECERLRDAALDRGWNNWRSSTSEQVLDLLKSYGIKIERPLNGMSLLLWRRLEKNHEDKREKANQPR